MCHAQNIGKFFELCKANVMKSENALEKTHAN